MHKHNYTECRYTHTPANTRSLSLSLSLSPFPDLKSNSPSSILLDPDQLVIPGKITFYQKQSTHEAQGTCVFSWNPLDKCVPCAQNWPKGFFQ